MAFCSSRAAFTSDKEDRTMDTGTCGMASDPAADACHCYSIFQASSFLCSHHLDEAISDLSPTITNLQPRKPNRIHRKHNIIVYV
jgi:hypothetical protein